MDSKQAREEAVRVMSVAYPDKFEQGNPAFMPLVRLDWGVMIESGWTAEEGKVKYRVRTDTFKFDWVFRFEETDEQLNEMYEIIDAWRLPDGYKVYSFENGGCDYYLARSPEEVLDFAKQTYRDGVDEDLSISYVKDITRPSFTMYVFDDYGIKSHSLFLEAVDFYKENGVGGFLASSGY